MGMGATIGSLIVDGECIVNLVTGLVGSGVLGGVGTSRGIKAGRGVELWKLRSSSKFRVDSVRGKTESFSG